MLQTHDEDDCCAAALNAALLAGLLDDAEVWTHEDCGMEWYAHLVAPTVRHWSPRPVIRVW